MTILGFLSLMICILELVLATTFKDEDEIEILREKGNSIVSLITALARNESHVPVEEIKTKADLFLNCVMGESKRI